MKSKIKWNVFNIGGGERISVNQLLKMLNIACKTDIKSIHTSRKEGDISHTWANIEKARKILSYEPRIDIKNGIKKHVEWIKMNMK